MSVTDGTIWWPLVDLRRSQRRDRSNTSIAAKLCRRFARLRCASTGTSRLTRDHAALERGAVKIALQDVRYSAVHVGSPGTSEPPLSAAGGDTAEPLPL